MRQGQRNSRTVATAGIFTAFVAASTMVFTLAIPATPSGYFNFGEVMVYICALLTGPYVGAFAGGVGSSIADVALGSANYAPGTLVIKAAEGFIVGYLSSRAISRLSRNAWRAASIAIGVGLGLLVGTLGATYYSGSYSLTPLPFGPPSTISFDIPPPLWVLFGVVIAAVIAVAGYFANEKIGWTVLSVLAGGTVMYSGYFLYNLFVLSIGFAPSAGEFPFDVGQALIGLIISVPVVGRVKRMGLRPNVP
jgi:uncharacterized membrane protein